MSAYAGTFKNTICEPSGETDADQPSSLNLRGLPPRIERVQSSILLDGGVVHDTNRRELSGNHPRNVTSRSFGKIECISPVAIRRKKVPDLSEYARYFPSGEIADAETAFSVAFVVNRCNVGVGCDVFADDVWRQRSHPASQRRCQNNCQHRRCPLPSARSYCTVFCG